MRMKNAASLFVLFVLISSVLVAAQFHPAQEADECGSWCTISRVFWGTSTEDSREVRGIWGRAIETGDEEVSESGDWEWAKKQILAGEVVKYDRGQLDNYFFKGDIKGYQADEFYQKIGEFVYGESHFRESIVTGRVSIEDIDVIESYSVEYWSNQGGEIGVTLPDSFGEELEAVDVSGLREPERGGESITMEGIDVPLDQSSWETYNKRAEDLRKNIKDELQPALASAKETYNEKAKEIDDDLKKTNSDGLTLWGKNIGVERGDKSDSELRKSIREEELKEEAAAVKEAETPLKVAGKEAEEAEKIASNIRWSGSFWDDLSGETWGEGEFYETKGWKGLLVTGENPLGYTLGGALRVAARMGRYRGFSNLIMPEVTQQWFDITNDKSFETLDAVGAVTRSVCEYDEKMTADIPGQSAVFVETVGGSYQFVGRIQAERSASPTYILCNPSPDIEEEERCPSDLVCKDELCYIEGEETPSKGYLYKIEWGVTAPRDEKFTPFIDENGKAVKFNIMINYKGGTWLYKRSGVIGEEVIELENGESDSSIWLRYLGGEEVDEACIKFSNTNYPTKRYGDKLDGNEICTSIEPVVKGEVEFGRTTPSKKASTGEVTEATDIW